VIRKIEIKQKNADESAFDSARWQKWVWACEFVFLILLVVMWWFLSSVFGSVLFVGYNVKYTL